MRYLLLALFTFCVIFAGICSAQVRPNIILILTDDQEIGFDNATYMPLSTALIAAQGTVFDNAYVQVSLCCPSRATFLKGQYAHNHLIQGNTLPKGGFQKAYANGLEADTIATRLQDSGYRTALIGKYLNRYPETATPTYQPPGWNDWHVVEIEDDEVVGGAYDYDMVENGTVNHYGTGPENYLTTVLLSKALEFIGNSSDPFFLMLAPHSPHEPATPDPVDALLYPTLAAPRPPSFNEADVSDKPSFIKSKPTLRPNDIAAIDTLYRNQARSMASIDRMIAAIATAVIDRPTYIFITTDNGLFMGEHRLTGKKFLYDPAIKAPLWVFGPGVEIQHRSEIVANVDFASTFAEIASVSTSGYDGRSLVPLFGIGTPVWRNFLLLESWTPVVQTGIRSSQYTYIESYGTTTEKEFYDNAADPYQLKNIFKANLAPVIQHAAKLQLLKNCVEQECRDGEQ